MELNEVTRRLPKHLLQFVVDQPYAEYTPVDQAVWRYVMRRNCKHLKKIAHASYLHGLEVTGVEVDRIPTMYGMNRILKQIGWAAVAVDGFIPPGAFMEFTQYHVLVIAADIRTIEHIEYTPAPDIIHESAGHAPILAVPEFADYLRAIGEAGAKAFSSKKDMELYEAIRHLSIIKEDPATKSEEIAAAESDIILIQQNMGKASEMSQIRNLHWWTVEYGLIGTPEQFKLYGAGLLSSIGEAISCLQESVKKLPYTLDAMNCHYDITKPQPQLFVTPDFSHLMSVLTDFKQLMAWTRGGLDGITKAIESQQTSTVVLSSGLQITGTFCDVLVVKDEPIFVRTEGATALSEGNKQLSGYGKQQLPHGLVVPIGNVRNCGVPFEDCTDEEVSAHITAVETTHLHFESGITVAGKVLEIVRGTNGRMQFINFAPAQIQYEGKVLWESDFYTMPVGARVVSAFAGPADVEAFEPTAAVPREKMHKIIHHASALRLQALYQEVRTMRESMLVNVESLERIFEHVQRDFGNDWLLPLEILELLQPYEASAELFNRIRSYLGAKACAFPELEQLIRNGLELLSDNPIISDKSNR